jgi:hypothetical protein
VWGRESIVVRRNLATQVLVSVALSISPATIGFVARAPREDFPEGVGLRRLLGGQDLALAVLVVAPW